MKVNNKVILSTAVVLGTAALLAGGTIAYFTDNESTTNNFTVGNVDVTLYESQLQRVNANVAVQFGEGNSSPVNPDNYNNCLNGNAYCTPNIAVGTDLSGVSAWQNGHVRLQNVPGGGSQRGVFTDAQIIADADINGTAVAATAEAPGNYKGYVESEYDNLVPGKKVRKFVYIKNTGENSAYARVKVTIPANVADYVTVKVPHTPFETSTSHGNNNINDVPMGAYITSNTTGDATDPDSSANFAKDSDGNIVMSFVYTSALKPGEMTYWSPISTVSLNTNLLESSIPAATLSTFRETGFGITVDVDAIQSDGFATAEAAFQAFDGQAGSEGEENV